MANNLSGLNSATRVGEGNANVMTWGNLDRAANQLYQEQKQREARGYKDYLQGQNALQKEFANVRSADIPEIINKYNNLKKIKQTILFDEKIKNNPVLLAEKQREAQINEADLRQSIKGSQEQKETDKGVVIDMFHNSDKYDSEKRKEHSVDMNLPLSQRIKLGRLDGTPYLYQGGDSTKLMPLVRQAMGTAKPIPFGDEVVADGGYKIEQKNINRGNNPIQYASTMYKGMQTNKLGQYASAELSKMTPQQIATITSKFNNIPDAEFEQKWGVKKEDLVNGVLPDDKTGQYVLLDAMQYAVNNLPQETKSTLRPNEAFKTEQNIKEWNRRNNITSAQKSARAETVASRNQPTQEEGNLIETIGIGQELGIGSDKTMKDGVITFNKDSKPFDGEVFISKEFIPSNIYSVLKASGANDEALTRNKGFTAIVKNGRIEGLKDKKLGFIDKQSMQNAQLKYNTEPAKGKQMTFGNKNSVPSSKPSAPKKPSGIVWKN